MSKRNCALTGLESDGKINITEKNEQTCHNWSNEIPINKKYLESMGKRSKDILELEACKIFLELEKLDSLTRALKIRQAELQYLLKERMDQYFENLLIEQEKAISQTEAKISNATEDLKAKLLERLEKADFWET
jgi:hypothetical protein